MRIIKIRRVVHDGRRSSLATPDIVAPCELGPYSTCEKLVGSKRCGSFTDVLVTYQGTTRLWVVGYCEKHWKSIVLVTVSVPSLGPKPPHLLLKDVLALFEKSEEQINGDTNEEELSVPAAQALTLISEIKLALEGIEEDHES